MKHLLLLIFLFPFALIAQEDVKQFNEGVKAHNAGDYATAIACYKKCLEINPDNKDAYTNIGIVHYNEGLGHYNKKDYDKCVEHCNHALKYNPKNENSYYMIGVSCKEQKKYAEAIAAYTKAIEYSKKPAGHYSARSWVYNDLHDNKNRLADLKKAVEHEPTNAEYQYWCGKSKQEVSSEEFKTAVTNYSKAIQLKPDYIDAYTERAAYYMTFQQFEKALPDLKKAKEMGADVDHLIEAATFELEMQKEED